MPRYHFHAKNGSQFRDEVGEELPDVGAAKKVALDVHNEMLPTKAENFWEDKVFTVSVKDETGRLVAVLNTIATLDPVPEPTVPPETP